jgi:SAM-dependent methyltransferase
MCYASPIERHLVDGRFYDREGDGYYVTPEKVAGDHDPVRFRRELRLLQRHCPGGPVLDVGCGTGAFLAALRHAAPGRYEPMGLEVSAPAREFAAKAGLETVPGPFESQPFPGRRFAAITFWAVLEHVERPRQFLQRAAQLLAPGGHCFILVPNLGSLAVRLLGARYRYLMPEHINVFSRTTLARLAASIPDLTPVASGSSHFNPVVLWQDWRRPREAVPSGERARLLTRTNAWKQDRRLAPARLAYDAAERALAALGWADNLTLVLRRRR